MPPSKYVVHGAAWLAVYLFFVLAPLFALLAGPHPPSRNFWTEFSAALAYSGLAIMGLQLGLTARFRYVTEPWGEDVVYHFHRKISLVAVALVVAHPVILFCVRPHLLGLLNPVSAPWRARFATLSTVSLIALVVMALWRAKLRIRYETWHVTHVGLALAAIAAGLAHMVGWAFYLDAPWKRALWIGLPFLWAWLFIHVRIIKPLLMLRRPFRVVEVRAERGDAYTLAMQPDGHPGFRFQPGQFAWLTVHGTPFQITAHPFSFSSSAQAADGRVEMTIRNLGDFTSTIGAIQVGRRVWLDGPYGAFSLGRNPADMHVLIAGGVGVTPMMSILRTLAARGDRRPVVLLYGAPDWDSLTFREALEELAPRLNLTVVYVLSQPSPGWLGERGFINAELLRRCLPTPYADHEYFICGPDQMMDAIEAALAALHVPMSRYHSERYSFA
jgi:predicted ferric reductase